MKFAPYFLPLFAALLLPLSAQEKASDIENHPAVAVVKEYLKFMLAQDWDRSAALVEEDSMKTLRDDYLKRVKRTATLDEEKDVVTKFKLAKLEDMEKMSPRDFYTTYHKVLKERHNVPDEVLKKVRDSMQMKIISLGLETENLAHVLVRTKHENDRASIENLELISLVKVAGKWQVGLNEQVPKIVPLPGAKTGEEAPAAPKAPSDPTKAAEPKKDAPKSNGGKSGEKTKK